MGTLESILEYRAYSAAKHRYAADPKADGDLVQLVKEIDFELAQEAIDGHAE